MLGSQLRRSLAIAEKDIRIYYLKGPVLVFGILFPMFLFLAFSVGRSIPIEVMISGLLSMTVFFTATAVSPVILPWEGSMRTLEKLISAPVSIPAIILGDVLASFLFGIVISLVPIVFGLLVGVQILNPFILTIAILLSAFCFSYLGSLFSTPPTNVPSNIMMISNLFKFPLVFISGIFIPLEQMPPWGRLISQFSPLTYLTDLIQYSIQGISYYPVALDFAAIILFTIAFIALATIIHTRNMPKRL
ncbi:MAG: ABC transporter permease [Methanotrichaceae archaeon]|nr:ABC transporter permease [Methanotrichaceae archaeon]